jgi:hypothetical protein
MMYRGMWPYGELTMWTRKDFAMLAVAAIGTFGMTVAILLPRNASAGDEAAVTTTIQSPVLKVGDCEVRAEAAQGTAPTTAGNSLMRMQSNTVFMASKEAMPVIKLTVKNTTDKATTATFAATTMGAEMGSLISRVGPRLQQQWTANYTVELKAGESKEIEVKTGVTMASGYAQLVLKPDGQGQAINALTFSVISGPAVMPAAAKGGLGDAASQRQVSSAAGK